MRSMSVQAVGGYIQGLIDRQSGLTATVVADRAGVQSNYIWRLKSGDIKEPSAKIIGAIVRAAKGSVEQAIELLLNDQATADDGYRAATVGAYQLSNRHQAVLAKMSVEELDALIAFVEQTQHQR